MLFISFINSLLLKILDTGQPCYKCGQSVYSLSSCLDSSSQNICIMVVQGKVFVKFSHISNFFYISTEFMYVSCIIFNFYDHCCLR